MSTRVKYLLFILLTYFHTFLDCLCHCLLDYLFACLISHLLVFLHAYIAKLSSVKFRASQVELRLALLSLNSQPTHPPTHPTRTSIFEPLLGYLGCLNLLWKPYSTNLGQLAN